MLRTDQVTRTAATQAAYAADVARRGLTALLAPYTLTGPVRLPRSRTGALTRR
jgi:hypothetical protein